MMCGRDLRPYSLLASYLLVGVVRPQVPFDLDPAFGTRMDETFVNSVLVNELEGLVISGRFRFPDVQNEKRTVRLQPDGSLDAEFNQSSLGGGKLTAWNDLIYVATTQTVRRLLPDGFQDPSFIEMNLGPYFTSLQGGDYHVYPDGRILISGAHVLDDAVRGFEGLYNLIWFSNTGYLDTTRTHRQSNGVIYAIEEQPDGKFLCTGTMTTYEGQPVSRVFRVHPDGELDLTFSTPVQPLGEAHDYLTLPDGRILVGGTCRLVGSDQVRSLLRLNSDGDLDESFNLLDFEETYSFSNIPRVLSIVQVPSGYIITGTFDKINGLDRGGIALVDQDGNLMEEPFSGLGCGAFLDGTTWRKAITGITSAADGSFYIFGSYHGYEDGTTNDTTQRMVSRLYGLDVGVQQQLLPHMAVYPNPTTIQLMVDLEQAVPHGLLVLYDVIGCEVLRQSITGDHQTVDVSGIAAGVYSLELQTSGSPVIMERVVVQR